MQDFRDGDSRNIGGVTYVRQGGQWLPQGTGAATGPIMGPPPRPPAPRDPLAQELDRVQIAKGQQDLAVAPYEVQGAQLDLEAKRLEIEDKRRKAAQGPELKEEDVKLASKRASLDSLVQQINRVDELYRKGFRDEAFGILSSIGEYLPSDKAAEFNAAGAGLAEQGLAAFRVPGVGGQSDTELRQFVEANKPTSFDRDPANEEKLRQLRQRVDATRAALGMPPAQWLGSEETPEQREAAPIVYDGNLGGQQLQRSTDGYKTVDNPELAGVKGEYLRRLQAGESAGQIVAFLRRAGVTDPKIMRSVVEQVQFRKANPNVPVSKYNIEVLDDMDVPLGAVEGVMNSAAQTAPGAYLMRAGNAVTANNLDSIVGMTGGNAERARIALEDAGNANPVASFAGDLSGSVLAALGGEAALAARGMGAGIGRALTADMGYGAAAGAGQADDGSRLMGALGGAAAAGAGSLAGTGAVRAAGSAISPTGGRLADLYASGVRPTPGQRLVESGGGQGLKGLVGRTVNAVEEQMGSVPVVGSAIRGARENARGQFQVGAFNEALKEIDEALPAGMQPGTAAHAFTQKKFDAIYDQAREGMRVAADEELSNQLGELSSEVANLAEPSAKRFYGILENVVMRRINGGTIEKGAYKKVQSELGKTIRGIRKSQSGDGELADALEGLQGALDDAARRHSDPAAVELLDKADRGYAKFVLIENASARGGVGKDAGTFSPNDFASAVKGGGTRVRSKAYSQGQGLMQDYAEQGMSLADRVPNSGTPERQMAAATLAGGLGYVEPTALGLMGAFGAFYAPGVRKFTTGAMKPRGPKAKAIAEKVRKKARITGAAGAGLALSAQKEDDQ